MLSREEKREKIDIKALVSIIPPASSLAKEKPRKERRIRVRTSENVKQGFAKINPKLAKTLSIKDKLEIVVAKKKKLRLTVIIDENISENEVWCNAEQLREEGIADNSIATVRAA
ncbi:MAG: hypothetical protein B6U76_00205 [Desulfurococcales archaeon ex4484_217_2]|nr:MAG: hypothetical protein B6U76_00205 [Desulfurococcales archaeon ex4484_217_2]